MQTLAASSVMYFTLELNSFDLHIRLFVRLYFPAVGAVEQLFGSGRGEFEH